MIRWFTKNHVAANLLMIGILAVGSWMAVEKLGIEVEPAYTINSVRIKVKLPGATPEDVEKQVILPIEKSLENDFGKSLPFEKGSDKYRDALSAFSASEIFENVNALLSAASSAGVITSPAGVETKVTAQLIETVLVGLEASNTRVNKLLDPVWRD